MYPKILARHYAAVNWKLQVLIFGRLSGDGMRSFSTAPDRQTFLQKIARATYASPCTYHRIFHARNNTILSGKLDTIPAVFVDVDYHRDPERKPYWGELYVDLADAGLDPTLILETPRGFHLFFYLENPVVMRWEKTDGGVWKPRPEATTALKWWTEISFALHRRIIAAGYPADTSAAGSPARFMRKPTEENVRHYDESRTFSLGGLNDLLESWKLDRIFSTPSYRKLYTTLWEDGAVEGERNTKCTKLAGILVCEYGKTPEAGLRILQEWARRCCTPAYPENEVRYVWSSAYRKWLRGELGSMPTRTNERTRREQGPYAARKYRSSTDEAIAAAVVKMQAAGCPDPWKHTRALAREAGITHATIINRKGNFPSE